MQILLLTLALLVAVVSAGKNTTYPTKSGIKMWVDPDTPKSKHVYTSSRGRRWDLVMSDEFNVANRSFRPGDDHLWTSVEKPDGVNGAMELYSHNMTSTKCDDDGTCYFYIKSIDEVNVINVYNMYTHPPGFVDAYFFYRSAMVQSWNKFCYQGGMLEVRAQLPGAISKQSGNPDLALGKSGQVKTGSFYPTWPGIWMMGNLGRAIFSASTSRMWPFSYNKCEPDIFEPSNQRISACDDNPGYGLNRNQGRGAPEIDILEGGGLAISSSLQIAPGMPSDFRLFPAEEKYDSENIYCVYQYNCKTPGANLIDIPTSYYEKERGHKSWYQGLRYASNNFCNPSADEKQSIGTIKAALEAGITENTCTSDTCPASLDPNSDLNLIDGTGSSNWGINSNGTCFPVMNSYMGAYLCDPDNTDKRCIEPRNSTTPKTNAMEPFNYQMDAISANWPVHLGAYTDYFVYQVEWVTGKNGYNGYVRWMLQGSPLFEVPSASISNVPQNSNKTNPEKMMLEEPMYILSNVALSSSWGATPPNPGKQCRGDGSDQTVNKICDSFPLYLKIDYIRLYQDLADDLDTDNYMQVGCDPKSHPTKKWIEAHIDEYQDDDNHHKEVAGKAFCTVDDDCTIGGMIGKTALKTGKCVKSRCECLYSSSWGGPRCTTAISSRSSSTTKTFSSSSSYGPPMGLAVGVATVMFFLSFVAVLWSVKNQNKSELALKKHKTNAQSTPIQEDVRLEQVKRSSDKHVPKDNYRQNFV
eukprot:jgi/Phyca11/549075/estExt2_Genewise1Plus.C_PHYCAscaffold_310116